MKQTVNKYDDLISYLKASVEEISLNKTNYIKSAFIYGQNAGKIIDGLDLVSDEIDFLIVVNSDLKPGVEPFPPQKASELEKYTWRNRKLRTIFHGDAPTNFNSKSELLIDILGDGIENINRKDFTSIIISKKPKLLIYGENSYQQLTDEKLTISQKVECAEMMINYLNYLFVPRSDYIAQRTIAKNVIFISSLLYDNTIKLNDKSLIVKEVISKLDQGSVLIKQLDYFYNVYISKSLTNWEILKTSLNEFKLEILKTIKNT